MASKSYSNPLHGPAAPPPKAARKYERNNMFQGNASIKKFDLNGQNVKIKLPKACPY